MEDLQREMGSSPERAVTAGNKHATAPNNCRQAQGSSGTSFLRSIPS